MRIGLTGTKASGKGAVAELLKQMDFIYSSTSDRVREEAVARGKVNYTIKDLQDIGNELREKFGNEILAIKTLELVKGNEKVVIDGIRNLGEIEELKRQENFILIGVDAPQEKRFERLVKRARESDPKTWEDFLVMDKRDSGLGEESSGQQVRKCIEQADYFFYNNYPTLEEMKAEFSTGIWGFLNLLKNKRRPSVGEVFMRQAYEWSHRSTCLRREVGAVISMENIPISAGYNGAVRNSKHCSEVGCKRTELNIPSGQRQELCRAAHAEQNAILNAGRSGRSVVGATLYSTIFPCSHCAKDIVQSGIKLFLYFGGYDDELAESILREGKVEVKPFSGVTPKAYTKFWG